MRAQRVRYLLAMGLPVWACDSEPPPKEPVASNATSEPAPSASSAPQASATASATATPSASIVAVVTAPPPPTATARGLSNVPSFTAEYPSVNHRGCTTAAAHCYLLSDLQKLAQRGAQCPAHEDVPQGCMGGALCADPDARTTGDLLAAVSRTETAAKKAQACCYTVPDLCCAGCGRALRDGERVIVTPLAQGTALEGDAARFAKMAAAEHASIASFARTSLELLALGAPADLVRDTHLAALDESEHARKCYALASKLAGRKVGPGALPVHRLDAPTYATFAAATFIDACVGETVGAALLREMASRESVVEVRTTLEEIAADEERHAELAFRTLAWAVAAGGEEAASAVRNALESLPLAVREHPVVRHVVVPCTRALLDA
jgi:hypothetical protein